MKKSLLSFYIISEAGEAIYNFKSKIKGPVQICEGMIKAFNALYSNFLSDTLTFFEGEQFRIHILKKDNIRFIGISMKKWNPRKALLELIEIGKAFLKQYPNINPRKSLNDISLFENFKV